MIATSRIAASFGAAAARYDHHAGLQRVVARAFAAEIVAALTRGGLPADGLRVLEIGCGTGLLGAALAPQLGAGTRWLATDLAVPMLEVSAGRVDAAGLAGTWRFAQLDLANPEAVAALDGPFDLICGSLVWQWVDDRCAALAALARHLAPGGHIALSTLLAGSLPEWRAAWAADGQGALPDWPDAALLQTEWPGPGGRWSAANVAVAHDGARAFVHDLRGIGAAIGDARPAPGRLRGAMRRLDAATGGDVSYRIGTGIWRRPPRPGVFVTGTDTGIGKTLTAAVLARALGAQYWKPLQTGLADEAGDTPTVASLAGVHTLDPAVALRAPLSPHAAAHEEGVELDLSGLMLPDGPGPLVVEGAGGLLVPADERLLLIDLIARFGLPVVLVARSGLGTINHTLLSLEALRARGIAVAGVVLSGPLNPGNRQAIEDRGGVRVLGEIPVLPVVDAASVAAQADAMRPALRDAGLAQ